MRTWRSVIARSFSFIALLILAACAIHAQIAGTGNIQGTVTDITGAVVPNATVTITDTASDVAHVTQTNNAGVFLFPNVGISTYNLKVVATGFETYVHTNIVLEVGSNIAINPALKAGATE